MDRRVGHVRKKTGREDGEEVSHSHRETRRVALRHSSVIQTGKLNYAESLADLRASERADARVARFFARGDRLLLG